MMKFIDLQTQYENIKFDVLKRIQSVLDGGQYILGKEVNELESVLADFAGVEHCVTCSSGTDALLMCLIAWKVGPRDAVITNPFTFAATAEVIHLTGATPVFVDIDPDTFNIDSSKLEFAIDEVMQKGELTPKAIIPVDLFGLCADYESITEIANDHNLLVLEDAAQSFGAELHKKKAGSFGDAAGTSFFPAKPLGCYGDGGAIFTNSTNLDEKLRSIRVHGQGSNKYENIRLGLNGRLDTIQAAVLLEKMKIFPKELEKRNQVANRYTSNLRDRVKTPVVPNGNSSAWAQYSVLAKDSNERELIREKLNQEGIPSVVYYQTPLHLQPVYKHLDYINGDFPIAENISKRIFSLPMHPYLKEDEIDRICEIILKN